RMVVRWRRHPIRSPPPEQPDPIGRLDSRRAGDDRHPGSSPATGGTTPTGRGNGGPARPVADWRNTF
ncbi:MAG: hypothetical protein ACRCY9_20640, partial [Phycicoccus sp.]